MLNLVKSLKPPSNVILSGLVDEDGEGFEAVKGILGQPRERGACGAMSTYTSIYIYGGAMALTVIRPCAMGCRFSGRVPRQPGFQCPQI